MPVSETAVVLRLLCRRAHCLVAAVGRSLLRGPVILLPAGAPDLRWGCHSLSMIVRLPRVVLLLVLLLLL